MLGWAFYEISLPNGAYGFSGSTLTGWTKHAGSFDYLDTSTYTELTSLPAHSLTLCQYSFHMGQNYSPASNKDVSTNLQIRVVAGGYPGLFDPYNSIAYGSDGSQGTNTNSLDFNASGGVLFDSDNLPAALPYEWIGATTLSATDVVASAYFFSWSN
jgi:hypothetical protein